MLRTERYGTGLRYPLRFPSSAKFQNGPNEAGLRVLGYLLRLCTRGVCRGSSR